MRECAGCGEPVEARFHYCPWCSAPQRRKLVEFFRPHRELEGDRGKALRVSRYFGGSEAERHVRFSVWNETGRAEAPSRSTRTKLGAWRVSSASTEPSPRAGSACATRCSR